MYRILDDESYELWLLAFNIIFNFKKHNGISKTMIDIYPIKITYTNKSDKF